MFQAALGLMLGVFLAFPALGRDRPVTLLGMNYSLPLPSEWVFYDQKPTKSGGEGIRFTNGKDEYLHFSVFETDASKPSFRGCLDFEENLVFTTRLNTRKCLHVFHEKKYIIFRSSIRVPCGEDRYCHMLLDLVSSSGDAYDGLISQLEEYLEGIRVDP